VPKLDAQTVAARKRKIEAAALVLFKRRGFHGVGLREIAKKARVSLGNLYNHYRSKDHLYESILARLGAEFASPLTPMATHLGQSRFPDDLEDFGRAVGQTLEEHADFLTLIYADISAFDGRHVRPFYDGLTDRFRLVLGRRFQELREQGRVAEGVDPAVAFTAVYMQFFNYFVVERMIGARGHMGLSDDEAIAALSRLFREGVERMFRGEDRSPRQRRRS
jgi:AcrR family transcriptional regulator